MVGIIYETIGSKLIWQLFNNVSIFGKIFRLNLYIYYKNSFSFIAALKYQKNG